jgi:hypothetical protein
VSGVILVDADLIAYRCGFACQRTALVDPYTGELYKPKELSEAEREGLESTVAAEPPNVVEHTVREFVRSSIIEPMSSTFPGWGFNFYLTGDGNFRHEYATILPYKGNRPPKPIHLELIRNLLVDEFGAKIINGQEADDEIAIEAYTRFKEGNDDYVIATTDKDLKMVPGKHFNFVTAKASKISEAGADANFWFQLLVGDSTDNIRGVPGTGKVRAAALLKGLASSNKRMYDAVREAYRRAYPDGCTTHEGKTIRADAALVENGILLWMRRCRDQIWSPSVLIP